MGLFNDPVEAHKITSPEDIDEPTPVMGQARRGRPPKQKEVLQSVPHPGFQIPVKVPDAPVIAVAEVSQPKWDPRKYRVKADKAVNLSNTHTFVRAGQIIDPAGFSMQKIEMLRAQGVELEEID